MPRLAEMGIWEAAIWIKERQTIIMLGMLLVVSGLALSLPLGYRFLFSSKYNDSIFYAYLFLVNIFCSIPIFLVGAMIKAHRLKKETLVAQALISITPIVLMIPLAYLWGLKGIVLSRIGQNVIVSGYCYILLGQKAR
jgi:O-antigen/teichoic acid export membrane protein